MSQGERTIILGPLREPIIVESHLAFKHGDSKWWNVFLIPRRIKNAWEVPDVGYYVEYVTRYDSFYKQFTSPTVPSDAIPTRYILALAGCETSQGWAPPTSCEEGAYHILKYVRAEH
jgi:hypothetical protein